jgi:hypothetical protein
LVIQPRTGDALATMARSDPVLADGARLSSASRQRWNWHSDNERLLARAQLLTATAFGKELMSYEQPGAAPIH